MDVAAERSFHLRYPPAQDTERCQDYRVNTMQITQQLRDSDRLAVLAAFGLAALVGVTAWFLPPFTSGDQIDLESLVPLVPSVADSVTGPGSIGSTHHGVAGLILIAVVAVTGLPLLAPPAAFRQVLIVCATAVTLFTLATLLRNGLLFAPSAALLSWVALRSTAKAEIGAWVRRLRRG